MPDLIDYNTEPQGMQRVYDDNNQLIERANFSVPFLLISKELERFEQRLFETEKDPDGNPWAPNKPRTIQEKGHDVVLHGKTGRLGTSLFQTTPDSIRDIQPDMLTFGENVPYSGFLEDGSPIMKPRIHVGVNDEILDMIADYIGDGVTVALGGVP